MRPVPAALAPGTDDGGGASGPAQGSDYGATPRLALRVLGRVIPVPPEGVLLGRNGPAVRDLPGMAGLVHVGRQHARIYWQDGRLEVIDLDSVNGTFLDGRRIVAPEPLSPGQILGLAGDLEVDVIELDENGRPR
jgi:hypothetical protein